MSACLALCFRNKLSWISQRGRRWLVPLRDNRNRVYWLKVETHSWISTWELWELLRFSNVVASRLSSRMHMQKAETSHGNSTSILFATE